MSIFCQGTILIKLIHFYENMKNSKFTYGVIEGFFGRSWSWECREEYAKFLKENGFSFYIYAPKGDPYLRRNWRETWPEKLSLKISHLASVYDHQKVQWGIGLSPLDIYQDFDDDAKNALREKVLFVNQFDPDILCVLFDDRQGNVPKLAEVEAEIFQRVVDLSRAQSFILCPTYYSYDPILEKIFGKMPNDYWSDLGKRIDSHAGIFWTGPKVFSSEFSESHLREITGILGRKPFIWDNYPVNDGERQCRFLNLGAFKGRSHQMSDWVRGHAVNPMNQAWLSKIPLKTLNENYRLKKEYFPDQAFFRTLDTLCGNRLAGSIREDWLVFQEKGLDRISERLKKKLLRKYRSFRSPYAEEIVGWLKGQYKFDPNCLTE